MSKVTQIYQSYKDFLALHLPNYSDLPNPYAPEQNSELFASRGFAVGYGAGVNTNRNLGCKLSIKRNFAIVLVRLVESTENDNAAFSELQNSLMEDAFILIKHVEEEPQGIEGGTTLFINDSGIEFLENDRNKYIVTTLLFETEYFENLT